MAFPSVVGGVAVWKRAEGTVCAPMVVARKGRKVGVGAMQDRYRNGNQGRERFALCLFDPP